VTTVFVTHDQEEAFEVADRLVVMNKGRIEQVGTPAEVFEHPATDFVMRFLGQVNVIERAGEPALYVRPHELEVETVGGPDRVSARVLRVIPAGAATGVELVATDTGQPLHAELERSRATQLSLRVGQTVWLSLRKARTFQEDRRAA
jgi:sulfate transport system ATP-binding protein